MKIGSRGSALALWQARTVAQLIHETGGPECEIVVIRTSGDESAGPPEAPRVVDNVKRAFVKEIEDALLAGRIDVAVHSAKDLPGELPAGLHIAAALEREDPRDALLLPAARTIRGFDAVVAALGGAPRIGTSSVRRTAELLAVFPGATFVPIRGNVDTRLRKLDEGACDVLVLAVAGVKPVDVCLPAPGQGIVAVEIADGCAPATRATVRRISDADAEAMLAAERALVVALGGGCEMPLGGLAALDEHDLTIKGVVVSRDGRSLVRATVSGNRGAAAAAGEKLAAELLAQGAGKFLS
jgi:hydroxymethylbilane synthase